MKYVCESCGTLFISGDLREDIVCPECGCWSCRETDWVRNELGEAVLKDDEKLEQQ